MHKYTESDFAAFPNKVCPSGDYTACKTIPPECSFGERCSFGEECSFTTLDPCLLRSNLGRLSDALTLELMRRDAWAHPDPSAFDAWAAPNDGPCPYNSSISRMHFFEEARSLWSPGPPEMRDYDLIIQIAQHKKWEIVGHVRSGACPSATKDV